MTQEPKSRPRFLVPLVIIAVSLALRFIPAWVAPFTMLHFMSLGFAPLLGLIGVLIWWLFARRASWRDRLLGVGAGVLALVLVVLVADKSVIFVLMSDAIPVALLLLGIALLLTRSWDWKKRRWLFASCIAIALVPWTAFRVTGQRGDLGFEVLPRWGKTSEARFLESRGTSGAAAHGEKGSLVGVPSTWPGFRGPSRDGVVRGVTFATDWQANPPSQRWRHAVGPAWSSFAIAGGLAFTQEQRGEDEVVVAYALDDGHEVWVHASKERFEEPQGGPGPRATPAYDDGNIYTVGANGTVTGLDAATGEKLWSRSLREEVKAPLPPWGFSSSPLVSGRAVIVFAGAAGNQGLVAYDRDTGDALWNAGQGMFSYGSPMPARIGGVEQVLIMTDFGIEAFRPEDGAPVWAHEWRLPQGMARLTMPLVLADERTVMLPTGFGRGTRSIAVEASNGTFSSATNWESLAFKPYFNDAVCHEDHCYGFDGNIFAAIDAKTGHRSWKGGRYGSGQVVLLADMDTLLVISDEGEVVLVAADPSGLREISRFKALEGKTWNHPVVADGVLLVRNAEEAACYELGAAQ